MEASFSTGKQANQKPIYLILMSVKSSIGRNSLWRDEYTLAWFQFKERELELVVGGMRARKRENNYHFIVFHLLFNTTGTLLECDPKMCA